jgi:hypothetical protein
MEISMALQDRLDAFKAPRAGLSQMEIQYRRAVAEWLRASKTKELCHV